MSVDGVAAAYTLLGFGRCDPGMCLYYVWRAYARHGAATDRSAPTAYDAWRKSEGQHPGDRNPPAGVPVYWGPKPSSGAGDVVISLGGGLVVATDWPAYGVVGVCTLDERERQISRPYLGWTESIFDYPVTLAAPAAESSTDFSPTPIEEDIDMNIKLYQKAEPQGEGGALVYTYALAGPGFWWEGFDGERVANRLAMFYNKLGPTGNGTETAINLTYEEWDDLKAASSA